MQGVKGARRRSQERLQEIWAGGLVVVVKEGPRYQMMSEIDFISQRKSIVQNGSCLNDYSYFRMTNKKQSWKFSILRKLGEHIIHFLISEIHKMIH